MLERLTWREVFAIHGARRGIRVTPDQASLLLDFGLSPYVNRREGNRIHYEGEGKRGDQTPTGGNAGLLECLELGRAITVFERVRPGEWYDRGPHRVLRAEYRQLETQRGVFEFVLEPALCAGVRARGRDRCARARGRDRCARADNITPASRGGSGR